MDLMKIALVMQRMIDCNECDVKLGKKGSTFCKKHLLQGYEAVNKRR